MPWEGPRVGRARRGVARGVTVRLNVSLLGEHVSETVSLTCGAMARRGSLRRESRDDGFGTPIKAK